MTALPKSKDIPLFDNYQTTNADCYFLDDPQNVGDRSTNKKQRRKRKVKKSTNAVASTIPKPKNVTAAPSSKTRITISWDDVVAPASSFTYTVLRRQPNEVRRQWEMIRSNLADTQFTDINAFTDFSYQYSVYATDERGDNGPKSKIVCAKLRRNALSPLQKLHNDNQQEITTYGLTLDRLILDKTIQAHRARGGWAGEISLTIAVYQVTTLQIENRLIKDAAERFPGLNAASEFELQRNLPKASRDDASLNQLRPAALQEALAAFALAGTNILTEYAGLIYDTARRKFGEEEAREQSITGKVTHDSAENRKASRNDSSKAQPFTIRVNNDIAFNGRVAPLPVFRDEIGTQEIASILTQDTTHCVGTLITYDTHIQPEVIRSADQWQESTAAEVDLTIDELRNILPDSSLALLEQYFFEGKTQAELAEQYEGTNDAAAIKRVQRMIAKTTADAARQLARNAPPAIQPLAVPLFSYQKG